MKRVRIGIFGLACALLSVAPVTAQEATPSQEAPTEEKQLPWREQMEQDRMQEAAAAEAQAQRAAEARETQRKHQEQMRALFYTAQPTPVRVLYDPVRCDEYERTGGPIAGIVVGVSFLGAGAGLAAASNGDKALLGGGIASTIASGVVLAKRKKARYQQALAGCPVIAK